MLPKDAKLLENLKATPTEVASSWNIDEPIIALIGNGTHSKWSRWSIIAPATGKRLTLDGVDAVRELRNHLDRQTETTLLPNWIGYIGYEFGLAVEKNIADIPEQDWPLVDLIWCDKALVHDSATNTWWSIGELIPPEIRPHETENLDCTPLVDTNGDTAFTKAVQKTIDYIHAGDIFQANITRRYHATVNGDIRHSALSMLGEIGGWFGAWIEFPDSGRFLLSMSPELFLQVNGETKEIMTRPMKGTRPEHAAPEELLQSEKDAAELHMIVDLMRNDLGRVCEFGSIKVKEARSIEKHPTVWQCVGEIHGLLRNGTSICDVLEATFPAGSITGAPKIRAMQIIDELENEPRGPYCGAIGIVGCSSMLNVAIRTAMFVGSKNPVSFQGNMQYSTGCGIVAESDPASELEESEVKTHILRNFYAALNCSRC
ncbi:MAG TPA: anthranilate synthase component I family protein [Phycisphaerales bacterium]|nr:anthranilate synthase component I family protein [Phycisphaerales bacterium]